MRSNRMLTWNAAMQTTVAAAKARASAITQLAVFEAVNAILGDYEPYLGTITALQIVIEHVVANIPALNTCCRVWVT
jgi:hypothetical protein